MSQLFYLLWPPQHTSSYYLVMHVRALMYGADVSQITMINHTLDIHKPNRSTCDASRTIEPHDIRTTCISEIKCGSQYVSVHRIYHWVFKRTSCRTAVAYMQKFWVLLMWGLRQKYICSYYSNVRLCWSLWNVYRTTCLHPLRREQSVLVFNVSQCISSFTDSETRRT